MAGAVMRLGIVRNPLSARNRTRRGPGVSDLGAFHAEPRSKAELAEVLARFSERDVRVIAVDGGDGTIRDVLTTLPDAYGAELPALAILASGKTNVIAADVGTAGRGAPAIERLVAAVHAGRFARRATRPVLEIVRDGFPGTLRGMVFGAAGFTLATRFVAEKVHARGVQQRMGLASGIGWTLFDALFGSGRGRWRDGVPMRVEVDGGEGRDGRHAFFLATTLDRLMLGIWPFWGDGTRPIRFLDLDAPPRRLAAAILPVLTGRPKPWMADGYRSGSASALAVALSEPFVLDGEAFPAGGGLTLRAGPTIDFVVP